MKMILLDRDGTLNIDNDGYIDSPERMKLFDGVPEAIARLNIQGYKVVVVSNQSGIARNIFSFEQLENVNQRFKELLSEKEAFVDDIFISPYHKLGTISPYNIEHEDRKPKLGMFRKIQKKYDFIRKESFMVGDKISDIVFGKNAGLKTILVLTGNGKAEFMNNRKNWKIRPDFIVENFTLAVDLILELNSK